MRSTQVHRCWWIAFLVCAILSIGEVAEAKPKVNTPKVPAVSDAAAAAVSSPTKVARLGKRRPSVDSGLRYSSNDWLINFITTPASFILSRIRFHLLFNVAVCLAVLHYYPQYPSLSIPMVGHSLLGSSLGLLLSYRTNSAYARFWEARGHWTKVKAICRNLAVTIQAHIAPHSPRSSKYFLELLAAFPLTLMHLSLGGAARLSDHAQQHLPPPPDDEPDQYNDTPSLPAMLLCMEMHKTVHRAAHESRTSRNNLVEAIHLTEVSHLIDGLMDHMSCCEKILRTPVPWTYSRHTSRFLTLWMGTLPFALVGTLNRSLTLAVVVAASYCMFGIEEIGHLIEQPFVADTTPFETRKGSGGGGGRDQIWSRMEDNGQPSALIKRGRRTQPYDIGIPVCALALQIRNDVLAIAASSHKKKKQVWASP